MAKSLTKTDFDKKVKKSGKPVLVDFFASWCGPCQMMAPIIEELAEEIKDKAEIYKVDVDQETELASKFQIISIPTILIFKDGKITDQLNGVVSKEELVRALK
ncbi:MAG: thioredoxin [Candidatus Berkelbacteria bacterium]|nr:thioredoxin [Candidatus Berkelbacteria bacterium]